MRAIKLRLKTNVLNITSGSFHFMIKTFRQFQTSCELRRIAGELWSGADLGIITSVPYFFLKSHLFSLFLLMLEVLSIFRITKRLFFILSSNAWKVLLWSSFQNNYISDLLFPKFYLFLYSMLELLTFSSYYDVKSLTIAFITSKYPASVFPAK